MFSAFRKLLTLVDARTRWGLVVLAFFSLFVAALEMVGTGLFLPLMQIFIEPGKLPSLPVIGRYAEPLIGMKQSHLLIGAVMVMLVFFAFKNSVIAVLKWYERKFIYRAEASFQVRLFEAYMTRPWCEAVYGNSADIARNLMRSVPVVFIRVLMPTIEVLTETLLALGALVALLLIEPMATVLAITVSGGVLGLFFLLIRLRISRWGKFIEEHTSSCYQWINRGIGGLKQIKVLGRERYFSDHFAHAVDHAAHYAHLTMMMTQYPRLLGEVAALLTLVLVVVFLVLVEKRAPGEALPVLGVFAAAAFRVLPSVNRIVSSAAMVRSGIAALNNVHDDLMVGLMVQRHTTPLIDEPLKMTRSLTLKGIDFQYPQGKDKALYNIDLTISKGEMIALVGRSGSGKTTMVDLMLGLIEPDSGSVLCDDRDIHGHLDSWRRRIAYVPQQVILFDDSLLRNIAFGLPDSEIDSQRAMAAATAAQLEDMLETLPDGMDTHLGENGSRLSGGQRQRVGVARALYDDFDLLVLDEATSALDQETERRMVQTFDQLRGQSTVVVVAHRLSTVRHCDRIIVVDGGHIVAQGNFQTLMEQSDLFKTLVASASLHGKDAPI